MPLHSLGRLSQPARQIIDLAAVSGRSFDFTVLQALTGHSDGELLALVKELMQRDGLHPNNKAQALIADKVWQYLQPLL